MHQQSLQRLLTIMAFKPKILLFSHISNPFSITGAEKLLLFFCRELLPYFDCILVAPEEGKLTLLARQHGILVKIVRIPLLYSIYTPSPLLNQEAASLKKNPAYRKLVRFIANESPQMILTNTCVHYLPAAAGKQLGIPVIWKLTEMITDNGYLGFSTQLIDQHSDWIISISESAAYGFDPAVRHTKMSVLYPSWNEEELRPDVWPELRQQFRSRLGVGPNTTLIGTVSSFLIETKGIHHFIEMALSLKDEYPEARFLIIGSSLNQEYEMRCKDMIGAAGAENRFIFAGCQDDVESVYCGLDIIVIPSLVPEGFGLTAMEGLLFGKPVIAYASGGLKELLAEAGCPHMLADLGNPLSLSEKLRFLLEQPETGQALGGQNRERMIAALGPGVYRARLGELVARWHAERPGWFRPGIPRSSGKTRKSLGSIRSRKKGSRRRPKGLLPKRVRKSVKPSLNGGGRSRVRKTGQRKRA